MVELSGSIALVTGGAQGIGRCFVEHLLAAGAKVSIGDLANSVGPQTQQELNAKYPGNVIFVPCDVTNPQTFEDAVKTTIQKLGGLTIIINNAGICDESDRGWAVMLKINIEGLVTGTKLGFKYMSKETGGKGGTVVNIASLTTFVPWDPVPVYSGTKAFVNQFSRSYGQPTHFNPTGVKVVSINPGLTDTAILTKAASCTIDESEKTKENFANFVSKFPIQDVDNMGRGLITVLRKAENGSMWVIENNEPAHELKLEYSRMAS